MKKTIITISGLAGAGKDTTAGYIQDHLSVLKKKSVVLSLGDFPKMAVADFFKVRVEALFGRRASPGAKNKARHFLIAYAEGIKNFSGADYWARMMVDKINELKDIEYIIIPDLRFQEELLLIDKIEADLVMAVVRRDAILPVDEDWLILGYHKGYLEGNQMYQYHNLKPELNPMAYIVDSSFDYVFDNNRNDLSSNQIEQFIKTKITHEQQPVSGISRSV